MKNWNARLTRDFIPTNSNEPFTEMLIIVLLISISLTIAIGFLAVFVWNLKSGQYDDMYTPSIRMLFDDKTNRPKENK